MAVSTVIGPTLGGYLTDYFSWRWCFFLNVPVGTIIALLFVFFYPSFRAAGARGKIDYAGIVAMVFAIVPLMLACTWVGTDYSWLSPLILGLIGFSLVMFIVFFIIESRAEEAIMPRHLFGNRVVMVSALAVLLMGVAFTVVITFVPLYFQGVMGTSATTSGNSLIPMMLCVSVSSFACGQIISRTGGGYRLLGSIGFVLLVLGLFLLSRLTVASTHVEVVIYAALAGFGAGMLFPLHTLAVQNTVAYAFMGTATSMLTWLRTIGNLLGLSLVGALLNNRFNTAFFGNLSPEVKQYVSPEELASIANNPQALINPEAQAQIQGFFEGAGSQAVGLLEHLLATLQNALNDALAFIFVFAASFAIAGLIVNFFLKGIPRHRSE
jgi:predicted MFS family arabinose efflux permease